MAGAPREDLESPDAPEGLFGARAIRHGVGNRDVRKNGARKQEDILRDHREKTAQCMGLVGANVATEDAHRAGLGLVQTKKKAGDGRLAGARRADESDALAASGHEADVTQNRHARLVLECDMLEAIASSAAPDGSSFGRQRGRSHVFFFEQFEDALGSGHRALQ